MDDTTTSHVHVDIIEGYGNRAEPNGIMARTETDATHCSTSEMVYLHVEEKDSKAYNATARNGIHGQATNDRKGETEDEVDSMEDDNENSTTALQINGQHHKDSVEITNKHDKSDSNNAKLIDARRRLFHEHMPTGKTGTSLLSSALRRDTEALLSESQGGRKLWDFSETESNNGNSNNRKRKLFNVAAFLSDIEARESETVNRPTPSLQAAVNPTIRPSFRSLSLEEFEQKAMSRYLPYLAQNQNGVIEDNSVSNSERKSHHFTLQFNECSVIGLSKWAANQAKSQKNSSHASINSNNPLRRQIIPVKAEYRICAICHRVGHYEAECPDKTPRQANVLSGYAKHLGIKQRSQSLVENQNPPPLHCVKGFRSDEVSVELYCGVLVEQSSNPFRGNSSSSSPLVKRPEDMIEIDGFEIRCSEDGPSPPERLVVLQEGDLVVWPSREEDGTLLVGTIQSIPLFNSTDEAKNATAILTVQCISVVTTGPNKLDESKKAKVGSTFKIRRNRLSPVNHAIEFASAVAVAEGVRNGSTADPKDPPQKRLMNEKALKRRYSRSNAGKS